MDPYESSQPSSGLAWPAVAVMSLAAAVYFSREVPFRHSRPTDVRVAPTVESHLSRDPLTALPDNTPTAIPGDIDHCFVVTVPKGDSPGTRERRRRVRHALHVAASVRGYTPCPVHRQRRIPLPSPQLMALRADSTAEEGPHDKDETADPSESSSRSTPTTPMLNADCLENGEENVLVVWMPEAASDASDRLIELCNRVREFSPRVTVIGPSSTACYESLDIPEYVRVYSPWVTEIEELPSSFVRLTCSDKELAERLHEELSLRGASRPDQTLLVLERDNRYASSWLRHCADAWGLNDNNGAEASDQESPQFPTVYYSRWIDGDWPPATAVQDRTGKLAIRRESRDLERPEGAASLDYLRRLRKKLSLEPQLRDIRAVGIFGIDVHDKLLILQALKPILPDAIYFTSDLDAYFTHPQELRHTRNLLVAAGHDLIPHTVDNPGLSGRILTPPFRDSYQSSAYLAFCAALGAKQATSKFDGTKFRLQDCLMALSLPVVIRCPLLMGLPISETWQVLSSRRMPMPGSVFEIGTIRPVRMDEQPTFSLWGWLCSGGVLLAAILGAGLTVLLLSGGKPKVHPSNKKWYWGSALSIALALVVWITMAFSSEPLSWWHGVSVWPTEVLRLFGMMLSLAFAYHVSESMRTPLQELVRQGAVPKTVTFMALEIIRKILRGIYDRMHFLLGRKRRSEPTKAPSGSTSDVSRALDRITGHALCLATVLTVVAAWLLWLFRWPHAPTRGAWVTVLDTAIMLLSSLALTWLVLLVVEFARLYATWCTALKDQIATKLDERTLRSTLDEIAKAGGRGIYGPFVVILVVCIARMTPFDNWTWPVGFNLILVSSAVLVVLAHIQLHNRATDLRDAGLDLIRDRIVAKEAQAPLLEFKLGELQNMRHGILAGPGNHPVLRALIIPFSGIGGLSLFHWFQAM